MTLRVVRRVAADLDQVQAEGLDPSDQPEERGLVGQRAVERGLDLVGFGD